MSRVAKMPVPLPAGVQITSSDGQITVKGAKASVTVVIPPAVKIDVDGNVATINADSIKSNRARDPEQRRDRRFARL